MKVADLLESRRENWHKLLRLCLEMEAKRGRKRNPERVAEFAALYRAACADLALADAYHLPPETVDFLHRLVGRAHNQLYRSRMLNFRTWGEEMFVHVPRRLFNDGALRLAFLLFWGFFLAAMFLASASSPVSGFAAALVGENDLTLYERMYDGPVTQSESAGRYIQHNTSIGLRVFAAGCLFGVYGLFETVFNAVVLGAIFGHMTTVPQVENFYHFVTAHGPFELTAIILSAAAGMRLGFSLVDTRGLSRVESFRRAARQAMPTMGAAIVLFALAALVEGFVSPSSLPYEYKAFVAVLSSAMLTYYFVILGMQPAPAGSRHDRQAGTRPHDVPPEQRNPI